MTLPLSPTARTTITRHRERGSDERADLFALLDEALVCHVGIVRDGQPVVLPSIFAVDPDGPDEGGTLYLHGSVAAPWLAGAPTTPLCATVTLIDGAVIARAAFSHSMNYRSAVVMGAARLVEDDSERDHALSLIVDHVIPGRSATLRAHTRKELAATVVLALPLAEASVKARTGGPKDEAEDIDTGAWAGVVPLALTAGEILPDHDGPIPAGSGVVPPSGERPEPLDRVPLMQRTLVLIKPDAVRRGLVGEVLSRFEAKGLTIVAMEQRTIDGALADRHYAEHVAKDFYPPLRDFVCSGPLVALVLEGDQAVDVVPRAERRHRRSQGVARHDPRRPQPLQPREPRPRIGLSRVGRARDRDLVREAPTARSAGRAPRGTRSHHECGPEPPTLAAGRPGMPRPLCLGTEVSGGRGGGASGRVRPDVLPEGRLPEVAGLLHDAGGLRVGGERRPALVVPVEEHPDPVLLQRVAVDGRALRPVGAALVGTCRAEHGEELVEVLDLRRCQDHLSLLRFVPGSGRIPGSSRPWWPDRGKPVRTAGRRT